MKSEITIGGQAVIEGVMMRGKDKYAIAVRGPEKKISTKTIKINKNRNKIADLPFIRGVFRFVEMLVIGVKSITYSANESVGEEGKLSQKELFLTVAFSIIMSVALFYLLPLFATIFLTEHEGVIFNLIDGVFRLAIFLAYLLAISLLPDVRRLFQYHGAEHKTVHCYEKGKKLTVKNVKKYTTLHPRCGTNFILIVFVVSIIVFSLIPADGFLSRLVIRLVFLPIIAGISYEILRFGGKNFENPLVKLIIYPGLALQMITTKEPEDDMIEVAIKALKTAL